MTSRHPIPGMNVIDHVNFAMDAGRDVANKLMIGAINNLFKLLEVDLSKVCRIAVCGNPFQMSLFQNIEIRDLAFAGKSMIKKLGITPPDRNGAVIKTSLLGIEGIDADVIIPPAVTHEIGADAMAMLTETGVLEKEGIRIVVDYGTNAEMALIHGDNILTGSAAAGPALEGQQIKDGMLAAPGAISNIEIKENGWLCYVLDDALTPQTGDLIDPVSGKIVSKGKMDGKAVGITGTGVVAAIACGFESGLVSGSKILTPDGTLHLQDGVNITSKDIDEAGKAIGALRAGYLTLMLEAGIWVDDVKTAYMSGASGLYVDAKKAQKIGMVTPGATEIVQYGNTSIMLARKMVTGEKTLDELRDMTKKLRAKHCMFASSDAFKDIYSVEISLWSYGMPWSAYNEMMDVYGLKHVPAEPERSTSERRSATDLPELRGKKVSILENAGVELSGLVQGCISCRKCVKECPESAISVEKAAITIKSDRCMGTACKRCEMICPEKVLQIKTLRIKEN
ncbi:methylamine methyltransferase corrinoid protein reductive activase [Candidatus Methanoplasma termitum]|uniref:Methylamine methyltransferase corrinoid protein reductive activase n=2 Tax=Candidatus Methanoplasma termitum TaxID=1577791 RepID=A0A0A7LBS0_9ARCH|nr:methylamine methyltransferase corrinoid protein reductive activase [Candidatus Methanoplasma termitum]